MIINTKIINNNNPKRKKKENNDNSFFYSSWTKINKIINIFKNALNKNEKLKLKSFFN